MICNKCKIGKINVEDSLTGGKTFICNSCGYEITLPNPRFLGELLIYNCESERKENNEEEYENIADSFSREKKLQEQIKDLKKENGRLVNGYDNLLDALDALMNKKYFLGSTVRKHLSEIVFKWG